MSPTQVSEVPEEFLCPITHSVMQHPIMTRTGISFERQAILRWLDVNDSCPITRAPLFPSGLVSNWKLQYKIMKWKSQHSENDCDCDDNSITECAAAPTVLDTFHALLEMEVKSDFESQHRKDLPSCDFASLDLDIALAMFE